MLIGNKPCINKNIMTALIVKVFDLHINILLKNGRYSPVWVSLQKRALLLI